MKFGITLWVILGTSLYLFSQQRVTVTRETDPTWKSCLIPSSFKNDRLNTCGMTINSEGVIIAIGYTEGGSVMNGGFPLRRLKIFKSINSGDSWQDISNPALETHYEVTTFPGTGNLDYHEVVLSSVGKTFYIDKGRDGHHLSQDNGKTWQFVKDDKANFLGETSSFSTLQRLPTYFINENTRCRRVALFEDPGTFANLWKKEGDQWFTAYDYAKYAGKYYKTYEEKPPFIVYRGGKLTIIDAMITDKYPKISVEYDQSTSKHYLTACDHNNCGIHPFAYHTMANSDNAIYTLAKYGYAPALMRSLDQGATFSTVSIPGVDYVSKILPVCDDGTVFIVTLAGNVHRSKDEGNSWEKVGTFPKDVRSILITPDGHLLAGTGDGIFKSPDAISCEKKIPSNASIECELTMADFPKIVPTVVTVPASKNGKISTGVNVNKNDYVCILVKGDATFKEPDGKIFSYSAEGNNLHSGSRKYNNFSLRQLLIHQGGKIYGSAKLGLKDKSCDYIPDDLIASEYLFFKTTGDYFIAENTGLLELEINRLSADQATGNFTIEIYTLSKKQHKYRNCFNKCPKNVPVRSLSGDLIDSKNLKWNDGEGKIPMVANNPVSIFRTTMDNLIERCYHPGGEEIRGINIEILGCQCVYRKTNTLLINSPLDLSLGTFDYGYFKEDNARLHMIFDVFPHVMYLKQDSSFRYSETPIGNIY